MPIGVEGLPLTLQRADTAQTLQTLHLNTDRAQQVAAAAQSQDAGRAPEVRVDAQSEANLDGLKGDERGSQPGYEGGEGGSEPSPARVAPPDPQGRGSRIDLQA